MSSSFKHYGVKGMRWGIRKRKPSVGSKKSIKAEPSTAPKTRTPSRATFGLSDQDLQATIKRIEMEKRYKELVAVKHPLIDRGKQTIQNIFFNSVQGVGTAYATHRMNLVVQSIDPTFKPGKKKKDDD